MKDVARFFFIIFIFLFSTSMTAQTLRQEKMNNLAYMVGDWVGTASTYKDGKLDTQIPAFQKIQFSLNKNIITIDLHSEALQLHTIIFYDEKVESYYYHPYYETGRSESPAKFVDGKLIVSPSETKRYIFQKTAEGFREHGEELINGEWVKFFEDNFKNIK